eukprot:TRINITY_DN4147_c1_g1_i2.p1 TRINITY_DN4147_c1_g1~~TRINITY_DN4147_c1_g1_i2.p1  ORF type:complete len:564 (-),score=85.08 TRINITY_DN4147_c1_g1_i2:321-2012(-)
MQPPARQIAVADFSNRYDEVPRGSGLSESRSSSRRLEQLREEDLENLENDRSNSGLCVDDTSSEGEASDIDEEAVQMQTCTEALRLPVLFSLVAEAVFCLMMRSWHASAKRKLMTHETSLDRFMPFNQKHFSAVLWSVFSVGVVGRLLVLFFWKVAKPSFRRHRTCAGLFMFFNAMQWVIYLACFFWMFDNCTRAETSFAVQVDAAAAGDMRTDASNGDSWRECMAYSRDNATACRHIKAATCKRVYNPTQPGNCVGDVKIGENRCCILQIRKLTKPVFKWLNQKKTVEVSNVYAFQKWITILVLSWVMIDSPMGEYLKTKDFSNAAWLNVLDAMVFSDYVLNDRVRNPAYGISPGGEQTTADPWLLNAVFCTWWIAFTSSLLSPILFTLFVPDQRKNEDLAITDTDELISEEKKSLHESLAQLDSKKAHELVDNLIKLQRQKYAEADENEPQNVQVVSKQLAEDSDSSLASHHSTTPSWLQPGIGLNLDTLGIAAEALGISSSSPVLKFRRGLAQHDQGMYYKVEYVDGKAPESEVVPIERVTPDLSNPQKTLCGPGCCTGC